MPDRLLSLGLATGHVSLLTLAAVLLSYLGGDLGSLLASAGTLPGTAGFLALWGVALLTHDRALASVDPRDLASSRDAGALVLAGVAWGAATGVAVFWLLVVGVVLAVAALDPAALLDLASPQSVFLASIGTMVALATGAIVGVLAATLDALVVRIAERFPPET